MLDTLHREGKQAMRRLGHDWQFSAGAILILALGIGANTAVFSVVKTTLFQPYPFADSTRLVNLYQNNAKTGEPEGFSYPAFLDLKRESRVFSDVSAYVAQEGSYQRVDAQGRQAGTNFGVVEFATSNHLEVLGMRTSLGRWFTAEEERAGVAVAVLRRDTWQRNFGADNNVIGQTIRVNGIVVKVIGVGPLELNNTDSHPVFTVVWLPISRIDPERTMASSAALSTLLESRDNLFMQVRARLRLGVTIPQAQAAMDVMARRLATDHPDTDPKRGIAVFATNDVRIHPGQDKVLKPIMAALLTVVGLVLVIACSNLATLLLVRNTAHAKAVSVRLALGATRWQLVRHLLIESMILSMAGAALGVTVAAVTLRYFGTFDLPVVLNTEIDSTILGFATTVATLCGIGFGLAPALKVTRTDLAGALREQHASAGGSRRDGFTVNNVLIVGQVAASFLLLMGGALAASILTASQNRSVGFRPAGLAILGTDPRYAGYDFARSRTVFDELKRRFAALPGVENVFVTKGVPPSAQFDRKVLVDGLRGRESVAVEGRWADPGYFETIGIPLLFGRVFDQRDTMNSPEVLVVSETLARRYFGTANAVGKRLRFADAESRPLEIVGVVGDTRDMDSVTEVRDPLLYRSATQAGVAPSVIVARTSRNEVALVRMMQQEVQRLHPELPIMRAETMEQHQRSELMPFRIGMLTFGGVGAVGLALAAVGLYAVVAFAVVQRSREIGIRAALGARPADLTRLVIREVTTLVLTGIVIGSALSWTGLIVFESSVASIVGVSPTVVAAVAMLIAISGATAAYLPARRAAQADPLVAIRHQ